MEAELFKDMTEKAFEEFLPELQSDIEHQWLVFKEELVRTVESIAKQRNPQQKKKQWISDGTWEIIEQRRHLNARGVITAADKDAYRNLCVEIQKRCRQDKNRHLTEICAEVEKHAQKYQTADLFKKVKQITRQFKTQSWVIEDENGSVVYEITKVAERWKEYCRKLYSADYVSAGNLQSNLDFRDIELEPDILQSEIIDAIRHLKCDKAPGTDNCTAESLKAIGEKGIQCLTKLCNSVWKTMTWPSDWTHSSILPIHKKGSTKRCENYRTIALISHTSKVLLHIINNRLRHFLNWQIPQVQAGFVKGKGTREQILNVRLIVEKCYEFNTPAVMCFVDYQKAFDCVSWQHLWHVLSVMGVPLHLIALIKNLYDTGHGTVKVSTARSATFIFEKGVRQGCIISPILFNIYGEYIMRKALENWEGGISVGGLNISNLRYADDTTLLAKTGSEMVELLNRLEAVSRYMGLSINQAKTKIMVIDRASVLQDIHLLSQYDVVEDFVYLGSSISSKGGTEGEIRRRIGMAKSAMMQLVKVWKDRNILKRTKAYIVRTLVFPIFLYGAEAWTVKMADRRRIDAFEMWCWRRMLRIPWTAHRTNVSILKELKVTQRLSSICLKRVLQYFGHIVRKSADNLEKLLMTGKIEGRRPRGRSPIRWSDQVAKSLKTSFTEALNHAKDRERWKQLCRAETDDGREHHDAQQ